MQMKDFYNKTEYSTKFKNKKNSNLYSSKSQEKDKDKEYNFIE